MARQGIVNVVALHDDSPAPAHDVDPAFNPFLHGPDVST
jgi:hypothetical protein